MKEKTLTTLERGVAMLLKVRRELRATESSKRASRNEQRAEAREERAKEVHEHKKRTYFGREV